MFKYLLKPSVVLFSALILNGCIPLYSSNHAPKNNNISNYSLPYQPDKNQSVLYFVQPIKERDVAFFGGALSDSDKGYTDSKIYIQAKNQTEKIYIGSIGPFPLISEINLCTKVMPGTYTLTIINENGIPDVLHQSIEVERGKTYTYALETDAPSWKAGTVQFKNLPLNEGKYYVKNAPPVACSPLSSLGGELTPIQYSIHLENKGFKPISFTLNGNTFEYHPTPQNTLYPNQSIVVFDKTIPRKNFSDESVTLYKAVKTFGRDHVAANYWLKDINQSKMSQGYADLNADYFMPVQSVCKQSGLLNVECTVTVIPSIKELEQFGNK